MQIKITEASLKLNIDGTMRPFTAGDVVTVDADIGIRCCENGWAEDVDGVVKSATRSPGVKSIKPSNVKSATK